MVERINIAIEPFRKIMPKLFLFNMYDTSQSAKMKFQIAACLLSFILILQLINTLFYMISNISEDFGSTWTR